MENSSTAPPTVETTSLVSDSPSARALRTLRSRILDGKLSTGEALPSERDLAVRLAIARGTVRAVLEQLEREGLIAASHGRRRIVSGGQQRVALMKHTIGVLCTFFPRTGDRVQTTGWERFIEVGALDAIRAAGLHALTLYPDRLTGHGIQPLIESPPCGVLVSRRAAHSAAVAEILAALAGASVPVVLYGDEPEFAAFDRVASDHEAGAYAATRWLIGQGRRRILRIWGTGSQQQYWLLGRDAGYGRAMREAGLEPLAPLCIPDFPDPGERRDLFEARVRMVAGYLLDQFGRRDPLEAALLMSDGWVAPVAAACRLFSKEPNRDVLLAGYDNYWADCPERVWEPCGPAVTVDKLNLAIGEQMVNLLRERIGGQLPPEPQRRLIPPQLVVVGGAL